MEYDPKQLDSIPFLQPKTEETEKLAQNACTVVNKDMERTNS
jgi:hypothetical protein